ncbi:protein Smaug homolog 1 [Copidosoma floridanum]|uniref:protein Smaug homolog 1 n=1 Tax=Copidosoma floridanum TaxID=29053 RepID=UPI0006C9C0A7|nr:protein Smaug homolog 1 [Copidosoma floridanum]XP_014208091.1 protein Smaug homolog 1 [Copidosoma floridanum]
MKWSPQTLFCEQVGELTRVFSQWNECEQTVVLYALLRRIPAVQARFLAQAVQHSLHSVTELDSQERNANNPAYINSLLSETTEVAINQLLTHLPLLRPGNVECKQSYLMVIPELINHCVSTGQYTEQTQQLLSYTLIHPAITSQDRRSLSQWLGQLEERISNTPIQSSTEDYSNNTPLRWDTTWQKSVKQNDQVGQNYGAQNGSPFSFQFQLPITRQRRSNSLTPPVASCLQPEILDRSGSANISTRHKTRSFSVSGDHSSAIIGMGPLSPPSSCASSGSEGRLDEASARPLSSGMRDVPTWLKTLRLHKYSYLFANLSYEEMLELTEDRLAEQGVTKGARHKLALSISKLQQRYQTLCDLEKDLVQPQANATGTGSCQSGQSSFSPKPLLVSALEELKAVLATPLKPSQENFAQDIPTQFTKVLGKLTNRLALESNIDDAVLCSCINIFEKVLQHDCFTPAQKEKVQQWRSRLGNPRPTAKWQHNHAYFNRKYINTQQHNRKPSLNLGHIGSVKSASNFMVAPHRNSISTPYLQSSSSQSSNQSGLQSILVPEKRPSLQETNLELMQRTLQRTYSAPRDNFLGYSSSAIETTEPEINSRLESLCLRMTEQAIGGFGEA